MGHPANQFFLPGPRTRGTGGNPRLNRVSTGTGAARRCASMGGWALAGRKEYNRHMLERFRISRRLLSFVVLFALVATGFAYGQDTAKRNLWQREQKGRRKR